MEMEESGRSATPVNCEQPDILVSSTPINEGHTVLDKVAEQCKATESQSDALFGKEDVCKVTVESRRGFWICFRRLNHVFLIFSDAS